MRNVFFIFVLSAIVALAAVAAQRGGRHTDDFLHYYSLDEAEHYLEHLAQDHPDLVSLEVIGTTSENRDIIAVCVGRKGRRNKPAIFVESLIRPREWISLMVNLYFIHMFTEHPDDQYLLDKVDLIFVPIANPDGYAYTNSSADNRLWNKNRRVVSAECTGVDIGANFAFQFQTASGCGPNFPGQSAASEAETKAIQNLIRRKRKNIKLYISLQAFGDQILAPYNYAQVNYPQKQQLIDFGKKIANAIEAVNNRHYEVGEGAVLQGSPQRGTSSDYAFGSVKIPKAFTIKLPKGGTSGYEVPESELDAILSETWPGYLKAVKLIREQYG